MEWQYGTQEVQACPGSCVRGKELLQNCSESEARCGHWVEGSPCSQHGLAEEAQQAHGASLTHSPAQQSQATLSPNHHPVPPHRGKTSQKSPHV